MKDQTQQPSSYTPAQPLTYKDGQWTAGGNVVSPASVPQGTPFTPGAPNAPSATTNPGFQPPQQGGDGRWAQALQAIQSMGARPQTPVQQINPQPVGQGGYQNGPTGGTPQATGTQGAGGALSGIMSNPTTARLLQSLMGKNTGQPQGWGANTVPTNSIGGLM